MVEEELVDRRNDLEEIVECLVKGEYHVGVGFAGDVLEYGCCYYYCYYQ